MECQRVLGLFQKRIEGDDALLALARLRFLEAGLGAELYAESVEELEHLLRFQPSQDAPIALHLKREMDIFTEADRALILDFARRCGGRVFGMVLHDHQAAASRFDEYVSLLEDVSLRLARVPGAPRLFLEYASGLDFVTFISIFTAVKGLSNVSACIDTGHAGLRQVKTSYAERHGGRDVCSLSPEDPALPHLIDEVQRWVGTALDAVLLLTRELGSLGKPLHYHLHDGHPLHRSPHGVSDHMSFLDDIAVPFLYNGKMTVRTMFGPSGLADIVREAVSALGPDKASFSLEMHPSGGRLPLGNAAGLFKHWTDKTNAERMNHWLSVIRENQKIITDACKKGPQDEGA